MSSTPHILVTGGAGFIGSHASKALARRGFVPVAYDNLSRGHRDLVKFGPFEEGEISDGARVREVLEKYRPVAVMHFAAFAYIGESVEKPALYHKNNVEASTAFLKALLDYKPLPLVFSSTCATYGTPDKLPITEDFPQRPINPYGETKLIVEGMLAEMGRTHKLPWVALRYFNAAGSDPEGEIGEIHDPETHIIPLALMAARNGTALRILGSDYDTPDGTCIRDFIHVTDIADAHARALDHLLAGRDSVALNLANTRGYSVKEVISECERVTGCAIAREVAPRRPGDPAILIGSAARAQAVLGWTPQRSSLETQIADAWRWLRSRSRA